ncbi:PREDICTED: pentatricopeptide repeat-containing protein At2g19280 [Nelumbo nucifera]|uniref:Pentatricopeptide repeat-containing protein At2g19280 n=2 Tax=Nelumbo nucifera TaxID=4432 RepID=A0A1U7ZTW8_NELNU|nr:PREDICTED: pentatricopeptide repeat-containing protein At2g19280 [Nelumbo nucifera]XP_010251804.1 PREDICTED: pentatricopeptide repeat-containing protein At2g19280 [Nelumbo nucifera]XP_010251805.1 PREDICTED: pentatricopeptide repeat-containing protein At2g19280 [Nelumbo nucifera]XP_010251806.1 PREDICTED: pentatricopeptide repeat-containing protein At2g19280 [Nelumbo nucifera]XP_010251807.1 PREDICTED: pentatricopeptide repeat-containing protein At2g19280 [Nelumbo nucifera]XP_010251808.1 PREDI
MRASSFSIINGNIGRLKLLCGKNRKPQFFPFRSLASPCSSFSEDEDFVPECSNSFDENFEENIEWGLVKSIEYNGLYLNGKAIDDFSVRNPLGFVNERADELSMKRIKTILSKRGWLLNVGKEHGFDLNPWNVTRILNDLFDESLDAALSFYFFKWCETCTGSRHAIRPICAMINILILGNMNYRAVDLIFDLVGNKDGGEEWHNLVFKGLEETCKDRRVTETVLNMLVNSYVKENMTKTAVNIFYKMIEINILPTLGVCNSLLKALLNSKQMEMAWKVLGEILNLGLGLNVSFMSLFVHEYCAEGSIKNACKLIAEMWNYGLKPDIVAYTIVTNALCKIGHLREATSILFKVIQMGISLDSVLITSVIDGYCQVGRLEKAVNVLKVSGFGPNLYVYNSFISKLCRDGEMAEAANLFSEMSGLGMFPDCCNYTTLIGGYCKVGEMEKALLYLGKMLKRGLKPSVITYSVLIDGYCKSEDLENAEYLFSVMQRAGLKPDIVTYNTIMDGYGKMGHLHKVFDLLHMMRLADISPDVATYNIIVSGLAKRGFAKESKEILEELLRRGFSPNVSTFTNIISGFSKEGNFEEAFLVWSYMSEHGMRPDVVTCSSLLHGYCKAGHMDGATVLFRKMLDAGLDADIVLYNTLINGFCNQGNMDDACHLISMMAEKNVIPNYVTYKALVRGFEKKCIDNPVKNAAIKMQKILQTNGIDVDISQYMSTT